MAFYLYNYITSAQLGQMEAARLGFSISQQFEIK